MQHLLRLFPLLFAAPVLAQASPTPTEAERLGTSCAQTVHDAGGGGCLEASVWPTIGKLYPLSQALNVDGLTGAVQVGHVGPSGAKLDLLLPAGDLLSRGARVHSWRANSIGLETSVFEPDPIGQSTGVLAMVTDGLGSGVDGRFGLYPQPIGGCGVSGVTAGHSTYKTYGVAGYARSSALQDDGVAGFTQSDGFGSGVFGAHLSSLGTGAGVQGQTESNQSYAVAIRGVVTGTAPNSFSTGVKGINKGTGSVGIGVWGSQLGSGYGVYGTTSGAGYGVIGSAAAGGFGVFSSGDMGTTGAKAFVQPHPSDASKEIRFVCLEGNESGTYFRGSARLEGGLAVIDVPEDFRLVSEPSSITVQVTKRGRGDVWVESADLERVVVRGDADLDLDYFVNGVRRGYAGFETIRDNRNFVPRVQGEPFGAELAAEVRALLIANGTLRADFTPNEATADRLGWTLIDPPQPEPTPRRPDVTPPRER